MKEHHSPDQSPSPTQVSPNIHGADWERNALMDKMVRIQRDNAKKNDKIDFLEEHVQDLVCELQKKNRLLQLYFVKEESGILASEASDKHKVQLLTQLVALCKSHINKSFNYPQCTTMEGYQTCM